MGDTSPHTLVADMLEPGGDSFAVVIQLTGTTGSLTQVQGSLPYCEGNARMSKEKTHRGMSSAMQAP